MPVSKDTRRKVVERRDLIRDYLLNENLSASQGEIQQYLSKNHDIQVNQSTISRDIKWIKDVLVGEDPELYKILGYCVAETLHIIRETTDYENPAMLKIKLDAMKFLCDVLPIKELHKDKEAKGFTDREEALIDRMLGLAGVEGTRPELKVVNAGS